jgi:ADP-heptose:LPS heptosyltransferase
MCICKNHATKLDVLPGLLFLFLQKLKGLKKFLIIRLSSIGDIVLTTPVIRCLKKQIPGCEIHYLTKSQFLPVLQSNPYINKIITVNKSPDEALEEIKAEKYDQVIDLHKNFRSVKLRRKLRVKSTSFPKLNDKKWMLVNLKIDRMPDIHIVDRYFEAVKNLGVANDQEGLDYFLAPEDVVDISKFPDIFQPGYVAFVIGGKHKTKQLPTGKAIELSKMIDHPVLILGGPEDRQEGEEIAKVDPGKIYNTCGNFKLNQSASLVKQAKVVITNDTGLMHVAAAFKKQIISIWGNTVPQLGMYPYLPKNPELFSIYEVNNLSCRPCSKIGFEKCPKKHFKCMMDQDVEKIAEEVNSRLEADGYVNKL